MAEDVYQAVISKRDRREFDSSKPLPDDVVHRILQAGRMAGTASNKQGLRFIAIRDAGIREALSTTGPGAGQIARSPFVVAIAAQKDLVPFNIFDVGRAAQNMMLTAWAEGIFSCPVGIRDADDVRTVLGFPEEYEVRACVAFGYPQPDLEPRESRPRLPMDEVIRFDRW